MNLAAFGGTFFDRINKPALARLLYNLFEKSENILYSAMYSCLAKPGLGQGLTRFSYILYILNILSILSKKWDFLCNQVETEKMLA